MTTVIANNRGIALVITLLVVALLTITVVEFTYSVEIDAHMAHNAMNAVQASLLARSGINLGEALLLHDDDGTQNPQLKNVDAFTEDWCTQFGHPVGGEHPSCDVNASALLQLPDNMVVLVRIVDESGKFNINLAKPQTAAECRQWNVETSSARQRLEVLVNLFTSRGVGPELVDSFQEYWANFCTSVGAAPGQSATGTSSTTPSTTPTTGQTPSVLNNTSLDNQIGQLIMNNEFPSLDDAGVIPGFTPTLIRQLRPVLTAVLTRDALRMLLLPGMQLTPGVLAAALAQVNVNTASRVVLMAVMESDDAIEEIVNLRQDHPLVAADLAKARQGIPPDKQAARSRLLGVSSVLFRIHASAIVNPNPMTGAGGVRRSASMLVKRFGYQLNPPPGVSHWTLTQLDWQKEGGATLLDQNADQEPPEDNPLGSILPGRNS
jgi:type II secretory pathway component PulK